MSSCNRKQREGAHDVTPQSNHGDRAITDRVCEAGGNRGALQLGMRFRDKGLFSLRDRDNAARLPANLIPPVRRVLIRLHEAAHPRDADAPGFRLHSLTGGRARQWSVRVSRNLHVVFRFEHGEAEDVDLIDH